MHNVLPPSSAACGGMPGGALGMHRETRATVLTAAPDWKPPRWPSTVECIDTLWYSQNNGMLHRNDHKCYAAKRNTMRQSHKLNIDSKKQNTKEQTQGDFVHTVF